MWQGKHGDLFAALTVCEAALVGLSPLAVDALMEARADARSIAKQGYDDAALGADDTVEQYRAAIAASDAALVQVRAALAGAQPQAPVAAPGGEG